MITFNHWNFIEPLNLVCTINVDNEMQKLITKKLGINIFNFYAQQIHGFYSAN